MTAALVWRVVGLLWAGGVLLTIAALAAGAATDRAQDGQRCDDEPMPLDGSLTDAESTVWHEIVAGYGRRGSIA